MTAPTHHAIPSTPGVIPGRAPHKTTDTTAHVMLTTRDLATRWQVSAGHLANLRSAGGGPAYRRIGAAVRYSLADVEAYEHRAFVATEDQPGTAN